MLKHWSNSLFAKHLGWSYGYQINPQCSNYTFYIFNVVYKWRPIRKRFRAMFFFSFWSVYICLWICLCYIPEYQNWVIFRALSFWSPVNVPIRSNNWQLQYWKRIPLYTHLFSTRMETSWSASNKVDTRLLAGYKPES